MSRAAFVGDPPELMLKGIETNTYALEQAKSIIKPGVPANQAFEVARDIIDNSGLPYKQGRRVAYSIGIAFPPGWDEGHIISINETETREFQAGMTFHLITTMRLPGLGAIGCSDTILVTENGCETLTANVGQKLYVK
jgi:Xaa-Pro dipeptidase